METNRSVLVTGCSSGIGEALAHMLHERGWQVFATARKSLDVHYLEQAGLEAIQLDLNDSLSITLAVDKVLEATGGRLDALVNNAAQAVPGAVEDLRREAMRAQFEPNVFGTIELTGRIIPVMREQGHGRIIMLSSILGLVAMPWRGNYNASKYALEGFTDTLRMELARDGIQVVTLNPGPVESHFRRNALSNARRYVDMQASVHRERYARLERQNSDPEGRLPGSVSSEAAARKVIRALESRRPRLRYYVTWAAVALAIARRWLPARWLDRILRKI
jgi:NAD(P)-dependent dehydrogenase (short-subunit alcohol dehydrogenase family)